jgi:hypothetical protein
MRRRDLPSALLLTAATTSVRATALPAQATSGSGYAQTSAEQAAGVTPASLAYPPGHLDRYRTNAIPGRTDMSDAMELAAAQAVRADGMPVTIASGASYRLARTVTVPVGARLDIGSGQLIVDPGNRLVVGGIFSAPRVPCLVSAATPDAHGTVVFGKGAVAAIYPEWFGASGATATHGGAPDSTAAFAAAVAAATENGAGEVAIHPISVAPGNFTVGNLTLPPATTIRGTGRHTTNIFCAKNTRGVWWTDSGSAAKIIIEDLALYGNNEPQLTAGLRLGRNAIAHGTEGYINRIWIRDIPNGAGLDVLGNVGLYDTITVQNTALNIKITGSANMARGLISMALRSGRGRSMEAIGVWLGGATVSGVEIEAMDSDTVPLRIDDNVSIQGLWMSFAPDTTYDHLWELGPRATTWAIENLSFYFKGRVSVKGGNARRADGTYFGGNASGARGNHDGEGNYFSESSGQKLQSFTLQLTNANGRIRHLIAGAGEGDTRFAQLISAASAVAADTPVDAREARQFAAGITVAGPGTIWLDTADQRAADAIGLATIAFNSTGVPLNVLAAVRSTTVGAVKRNRLIFQLTHATTGALFAIGVNTIAPGTSVKIAWQGYLAG